MATGVQNEKAERPQDIESPKKKLTFIVKVNNLSTPYQNNFQNKELKQKVFTE